MTKLSLCLALDLSIVSLTEGIGMSHCCEHTTVCQLLFLLYYSEKLDYFDVCTLNSRVVCRKCKQLLVLAYTAELCYLLLRAISVRWGSKISSILCREVYIWLRYICTMCDVYSGRYRGILHHLFVIASELNRWTSIFLYGESDVHQLSIVNFYPLFLQTRLNAGELSSQIIRN